MDIVRLEELSPEKRAVLKPLEEDSNVPVLEMSTITDFGVMEVKLEACERLLAFRVDQKIKTKKVVNLKIPQRRKIRYAAVMHNLLRLQVEGLLNRLHIAQPKKVDPRRVPCIPDSVLKRRLDAAEKAVRKRKLEREIEEEMGDDYVLDLKKNYDIEGDQKYDVIPEIWEGHNIADYIDPDIFEVSVNSVLSKLHEAVLLQNVFLYHSSVFRN